MQYLLAHGIVQSFKKEIQMCVPEHQKDVLRDTPWGKIRYIDYKHKVEFQKQQYDYIDQYCELKPVDWSASVWDLNSLDFLMQYELPFIKIPSAMTTNETLVTETAKTGRPIIMSTGMCELNEVDNAVNNVLKYNNNLVLMHTNSSYPTPKEEINLNLIPFLRERYDCPVGYSGHEEDLEPTVIAVALGATVVERHITLSHDMWGTDQKSSLEVMAMDILYKRIKDINTILGSATKTVTESEIPIRKKLRG